MVEKLPFASFGLQLFLLLLLFQSIYNIRPIGLNNLLLLRFGPLRWALGLPVELLGVQVRLARLLVPVLVDPVQKRH